jgi:hypothetical protein
LRRPPPHTKDCRSGVCGSRMTCLGPGREGMGITSLGRDAQGLTFSAVIPARVMQPEVSTRGKQNWRIALCCYGMTLAQRHRVHRLCVASLAHLRCAHRLGCSLAGLWWRVRVGLASGPPLKFKYALFQLAVARRSACSRTCRNPVSAMLSRRSPPPLKFAEPTVLCTERMDLRTAASTRQSEVCSGHPCEPTR